MRLPSDALFIVLLGVAPGWADAQASESTGEAGDVSPQGLAVAVAAEPRIRAAEERTARERPRVLVLRQDEDLRGLRAAGVPREPMDLFKEVRLGRRGTSYISLGAEIRLAYEYFVNEYYGASPQNASGSFLFRGMIHADLWSGAHFRVFLQLKSALEAGRDGGPTPLDVDTFDIHQGFVQVAVGDPRDRAAPSLSLRVGRQELRYGAGRLVDLRDGPNVRRSFDAVLARLEKGPITVDAVGGAEVPIFAEPLDGWSSNRSLLWGVYGSMELGPSRPHGVDFYYLGTRRGPLVYKDGAGRETRHMIGARAWGHIGALEHDFELTAQFGTLDQMHGPSTYERLRIRALLLPRLRPSASR